MARVETGPVEFDGDWPGIFIRGDNSMWYAQVLYRIIDAIDKKEPIDFMGKLALADLESVLSKCYNNGAYDPVLLKSFDECARSDNDSKDILTVTCSICRKECAAKMAHIHQEQWIGDECCWDERLRASE